MQKKAKRVRTVCAGVCYNPNIRQNNYTVGKIPGNCWRKIGLVMKLYVFLLLVSVSQAGARGNAQTVSLTVYKAPFSKVLAAIKQQTGYGVIYINNAYKDAMPVSISVYNTSLLTALDRIMKDQPLTYQVTEQNIVISKRPDVFPFLKKPKELQAEPVKIAAFATVHGTVTDTAGNPVARASVQIKGKTRGAITDENGKFSIAAVVGDVLEITMVGYEKATVVVTSGNMDNLLIRLVSGGAVLTDVVVTSLGIKRTQRELTYNVQSITNKDINLVKDANFVNSLAGRVAGATINASAAGIGGAVRVVLRGVKSISQNNNALYVIDGVPLPNLFGNQPNSMYGGNNASGDGISNINPDDIENLTVMTGASASALYGSAAANGVVLISLKKGDVGKLNVSLSNSTGFYSPFVMPQFQNTYGQTDPFSYYSWGEKLKVPSSYRPKDFFQTGYTTSTALSVSTGTEKSRTYFSGAFLNGRGIIPNNTLQRYNFGLRQTATLVPDKLTLDAGVMYVNQKDRNMLAQGLTLNPLIPVYLFPPGDDIEKYKVYKRYDLTRGFKTQFWPYGDLNYQIQNPYWIINENNYYNNLERYQMNTALTYNLNKEINIVGRVSYDHTRKLTEEKYGASTALLFASAPGYYTRVEERTKFMYGDLIGKAKYKLGLIDVSANLGASIQDEQHDVNGFGGRLQSVPDKFTFANIITNSTQAGPVQNGFYHDQTQSVFGASTVGYDNKLFVELTARNDWPSQLAGAARSSFLYYSAGLSGILSDMVTLPQVISFLKLRGSYSEVGNSPPRYITTSGYPITSGVIGTILTRPSPNIQPERTKAIEVGMNAKFFRNKIGLDLTLYHSQTYNQLFMAELPPSSGYTGFWVNAGRVDNKGLEATLTYTGKLAKDLKLTSTAIFTVNRNKVKKMLENYYDAETNQYYNSDSINMGGTLSYYTVVKKGGTMSDIYVNTLVQDEHGYLAIPAGNNPVIRDDNRFIYAGNSFPKFYTSLRNSIQYKNFELNFMVDARIGGVGVSSTQAVLDAFGVSANTGTRRDIARGGGLGLSIYRPPASLEAATYYRIVGGTSGIGALYTYSLTNARLREAALSYTFDKGLFKNKIRSISVAVTGRNLLMFYSRTPFDPELTASTGTYYQGIDYFMQPSLRNIGCSVRFNF